MVGTVFFFDYIEGFFIEIDCGLVFTHAFMETCEVVQGCADIGMGRAEGGFVDLEGAGVERKGFFMLTQDSVEFAEIIQGLGNFRVIKTKNTLPDFKGSRVELQGFFVAAFLDIDTSARLFRVVAKPTCSVFPNFSIISRDRV